MSPATAQDLASAFVELRSSFGVPAVIGGQSVTVVAAENELSRELIDGGFADEGDVEIKALLSDLATLPARGTACTYNGRGYKVHIMRIQPGGLIGEYVLRPAKR